MFQRRRGTRRQRARLLLALDAGGIPNPAWDLGPFNEALLGTVTSPVVASLVLFGTAGFGWELRENGLLLRDERTLKEKIDDMRREKAPESPLWTHPDVDDERRLRGPRVGRG